MISKNKSKSVKLAQSKSARFEERIAIVADANNMEVKRLIGLRIRAVRNSKNLTQEQLAERTGITPQFLGNIERGKENPTLNTFISLSEALGVELGEIFHLLESEDPKKAKSLIQDKIQKADDEKIKLISKLVSAVV